MAPAPSPNACGLAAYRQFAGNLRVSDIDHRYWTTRKGNALRYALWHERRRHAAPYLREIAPHFGKADSAHLGRAADAFEKETALLKQLTDLLPVGGNEKAHWDEGNITRAEKLLLGALEHHEAGIAAIQAVVHVDFSPFATKDADALEKLVAAKQLLTSEAALAALVKLAPKDLDARLARLMATEADEKKERADGPIHRHLLFALAKLDSEIATEAIAEAILFPGQSDDVSPAVSNWAAEIYWERKGKAGKDVFVRALVSDTPHVVDQGIKYLGMTGDKSVLPVLLKFEKPAAYYARIQLGDEAAWPLLIRGLSAPNWFESYGRLRELGSAVEPHVFPYLEDENPQVLTAVAALLSRVGTEKSLPLVAQTAARNPENARVAQALSDLKQRLGKD